MKRSLLFLFALFFIGNSLAARPVCSKQLTPILEKLYALDDARQVIESVEKAGPISIKAAYLGKNATNASWQCDQRTICINLSNPRSEGSLIRSLLFELHNALNQKEFDRLDSLASRKMISRNSYIRAVEKVEHHNALQTISLLNKGMDRKLFPQDCYWPIDEDFEQHFALQLQAGHAQQIGMLYDSLAHNY